MKKHFLLLTEDDAGTNNAAEQSDQKIPDTLPLEQKIAAREQRIAARGPRVATRAEANALKTTPAASAVETPAQQPQQTSQAFELKTNMAKTAIEIVHKNGNLTNIPNKILSEMHHFNDLYLIDSDTKKYFVDIELKNPDSSNAATKFNELETEIIKAEQYAKTSKNLKDLIGSDAKWEDENDHTKGVIFNKDNYKNKSEEEMKKAEEKFNKRKAQAEHIDSTKTGFSFANANSSGITPISILNSSLGLIRELMTDLNNLTKLSIFSTNFHKNYNNNLKFFESALTMSKALHNKSKIEQKISDTIKGVSRVSRINNQGTASDNEVNGVFNDQEVGLK